MSQSDLGNVGEVDDTDLYVPKLRIIPGTTRNLIIAVILAFVIIGVGILIWQLTKVDGFQSRNYSHTLRQNLNPFQKWATSQHESQTYQYPKNIPVYKPMHGEVTQYMYAKNPNFD